VIIKDLLEKYIKKFFVMALNRVSKNTFNM
jgi:hypothetical protein